MKHSFIALSIAALFTVTFVGCSKQDLLPNDSMNTSAHLPGIVKPGIKILPVAKSDTPYGKINTSTHLPVTEEPAIKIIPVAKSDTPYGKIRVPVINPE